MNERNSTASANETKINDFVNRFADVNGTGSALTRCNKYWNKN